MVFIPIPTVGFSSCLLTEALEYPRSRDDWLKTVLIGGLLGLFTWLLVPAILLAGDIVRVLRGSVAGNETPPVFEGWDDLFGDGLRASVIAFVYGLIPALVLGLTAVVGGLIAAGGGDVSLGASGLVVLLGGLLALVLGLLAAYVVPAAVANYAETGRMGAGFSWSTLRPVLFSGTYATAWATAFVIILVAGVVSDVLNVVPLLGLVVGAFVGFYAAVSAYYVVGRAWAEMHPVEAERMDRPENSPAV